MHAGVRETLVPGSATRMGWLSHLHGGIALVLLGGLLFADEAGVPIPVAPNEVLLVLGGVLIQAHTLHASVFVPLALVAMAAGMLSGYGWALALGQRGVERVVYRLHADGVYHRVVGRLHAAGPLGIGVARLLPGVRPWATIVAGAIRVPLPTFLLGAGPTLLLWGVAWIALGMLVGLPAVHYFGLFERLLARGGILLVLGAAAYAGIQRLRVELGLGARRPAPWLAWTMLVGGAAIAGVAAGLLSLGRGILHVRHRGWVDVVVVLGVLTMAAAIALLRTHPFHHGKSGTPEHA
jgi:membrane protein DedA with SNARE-associated domain